MSEANIMRQVQVDVSAAGARTFRNNTGTAWIGQSVGPVAKPTTIALQPGDVVIRAARRFHAGLCEGSSDLIGWTPVRVDVNHFGCTMAVFTALEVKSLKGRVSPKQANFIEQVSKSGGLAGMVRDSAQALDLIRRFELGAGPQGRVND